jgi:hypothetical protein
MHCTGTGQLAALTNKWHIIKTALHFCFSKNCSKLFKLWLCWYMVGPLAVMSREGLLLFHRHVPTFPLSPTASFVVGWSYKLQQLRQFSTNFPTWIWSWASCLLLGFYKIQLPASVYSILQLKSQPISSVLWVTFLYLFSPLHVVSSWFLFQGWIAWLWFDPVSPLFLCFHFAMMHDSCFWLLLDCYLPLLPCVYNA